MRIFCRSVFGFFCFCFCQQVVCAQTMLVANDKVARRLSFDGRVWRTTGFETLENKKQLLVDSDEFHVLGMDDRFVTIEAYTSIEPPTVVRRNGADSVTIRYQRRADLRYPENAPDKIQIVYWAVKGEYWVRKKLLLFFNGPAVVDRLEVERFVCRADAGGGGRGEPVFLNNEWFTGLEYPAGHSRHTDGNTPLADNRYYERVGNYSYIDLEGRDKEPNAKAGMLRLMHFPGDAVLDDPHQYKIESKTAVMGTGEPGQVAEQAFRNYLAAQWKQPRSFLHYNNWFEPKAKDLKGNALPDLLNAFTKATSPYQIKMDAMVADDGWQDRQSIWQPAPKYFPGGMADLQKLSDKLKQAGSGLGLWLSIGGTNAGVDWGEKNGYLPAKPNAYFSKYFRYYSLSHPKYKQEMLRQVPRLAKDADLRYYKHDFNQLSDLTTAGHPPTDRHGHEANLDAMIEILQATRAVKPDIYQNITNWIWFSPWWLLYADALWMLAGDDGMNGNWPEISSRAMATTDRDTYIWRMWGNPSDRPLVPISRLMTHGLIRTTTGLMESKDDTLQDWLEHVLMHYGRGTLLKEWYISPEVMSEQHWKALCTVHKWAEAQRACLNNTVFVGGRPDEGQAYGYIGWNGNTAVLVARNPSAQAQTLVLPFDASVYFYGKTGKKYSAEVVFPYRDAYPVQFMSGKAMRIELPGYATMAFEIKAGRAKKTTPVPAAPIPAVKAQNLTSIAIPADANSRTELLLIGYDSLATIKVKGQAMQPMRTSKAAINHFASYAIAGMPSEKVRAWKMASYNLAKFAGTSIDIEYVGIAGVPYELHVLMERTVIPARGKSDAALLPWPINYSSRRQTIRLK